MRNTLWSMTSVKWDLWKRGGGVISGRRTAELESSVRKKPDHTKTEEGESDKERERE